jgi:poly [ADP-ribose] polymerase
MTPNDSYIYLMKVEGSDGKNHNKFYELKNLGNGQFQATYGREGAEKPQKKLYPINQWEAVYREKTGSKKGYTDVTKFKAETTAVTATKSVKNSQGQIISTDPQVVDIINLLQTYANVATQASYKVEAKAVTQAQIDEAQRLIDVLSTLNKSHGKSSWNNDEFNKELTKLYIIIPRKMKKVADHLVSQSETKKAIEELLAKEQDLLDSMASQVTANKAADADGDGKDDSTTGQPTLLEALGLELRPATADEIKEAKAQAADHHKRIKRVFRVINKDTQKIFDKTMGSTSNKQTKLLWHGSRRQNWWFILQQGLKIRPAQAASFAGSAFGDGIYFASEDDKSMGYTDGGRWNGHGGSAQCIYMALYEVHVGKQYVIYDNSTLSGVSRAKAQEVLKNAGNCDSTWARKAKDNPNGHSRQYYGLQRDEYIVYTSDQSTIKYLIEFD